MTRRSRRRLTTLRARLLVGAALATAGILAGAGLVIYVFVRGSLVAEFDRNLGSSVRSLSAMTEQHGPHVKLEPAAAALPEFNRRDMPDYFAAWQDDGKPVATSPSLGGRPLPHPVPAVGASVFQAVTLPDALPGRQVTLTFVPALEDPEHAKPGAVRRVTLTFARHTHDLDRKLAALAWLLAGVGAAATLAAGAAMLLVVRRGLAPLGQLAGRISAAGRENLGERIELAGAPGELTAVVTRLNELLDRLQDTVIRERRFTADVAHELRTPLAGLEAILDVCATRRRAPDDYERTLAKCGRVVRGMHVMVENLMTLARADARQLSVKPSRVPLAALVDDCWAAFDAAGRERQVAPVFQIDPELELDTDADKLRIVLNNLLDNAVSHGDPGGWLRVQSHVTEHGVQLVISNSGSKLSQDDCERAFDRFYRGDAARGGTGLHCGLGLSLCREITAVLSGQINATSEMGGTFTVRIALPNLPTPTAPIPQEPTALAPSA